jgi:hypothetical protein
VFDGQQSAVAWCSALWAHVEKRGRSTRTAEESLTLNISHVNSLQCPLQQLRIAPFARSFFSLPSIFLSAKKNRIEP